MAYLIVHADPRAALVVVAARAWPLGLLLGAAALTARSPVALAPLALASVFVVRHRRTLVVTARAALRGEPLVTIASGRLTLGRECFAVREIERAEPVTERIVARDVPTGIRLRLAGGRRRVIDLRAALPEPEVAVARVCDALDATRR